MQVPGPLPYSISCVISPLAPPPIFSLASPPPCHSSIQVLAEATPCYAPNPHLYLSTSWTFMPSEQPTSSYQLGFPFSPPSLQPSSHSPPLFVVTPQDISFSSSHPASAVPQETLAEALETSLLQQLMVYEILGSFEPSLSLPFLVPLQLSSPLQWSRPTPDSFLPPFQGVPRALAFACFPGHLNLPSVGCHSWSWPHLSLRPHQLSLSFTPCAAPRCHSGCQCRASPSLVPLCL